VEALNKTVGQPSYLITDRVYFLPPKCVWIVYPCRDYDVVSLEYAGINGRVV
jgi:hypothetical protein